jgi:hypothetical protein
MSPGKKKKKPKSAPPQPRNPFAGRPTSGAGFHSERKYGKKDRLEKKRELDEEQEEDPDAPDA